MAIREILKRSFAKNIMEDEKQIIFLCFFCSRLLENISCEENYFYEESQSKKIRKTVKRNIFSDKFRSYIFMELTFF